MLASSKFVLHFLVLFYGPHGRSQFARSPHLEFPVSTPEYPYIGSMPHSPFFASCFWQTLGFAAAHRDRAFRDRYGEFWGTDPADGNDAYTNKCQLLYAKVVFSKLPADAHNSHRTANHERYSLGEIGPGTDAPCGSPAPR